jgi:hypothetical protein
MDLYITGGSNFTPTYLYKELYMKLLLTMVGALALPVLIVLGKGLIAIQLDINYQSFIFLLLGSLSIIIVAIPIVVSYVIKAHLE